MNIFLRQFYEWLEFKGKALTVHRHVYMLLFIGKLQKQINVQSFGKHCEPRRVFEADVLPRWLEC
jgi:hypothetical protein